jgi:hypothetical protein
VSVTGGGFFCPTSGHETDQSGKNVVDVDPDFQNFVGTGAGYQNARYTVAKTDVIIDEGRLYELRPRS